MTDLAKEAQDLAIVSRIYGDALNDRAIKAKCSEATCALLIDGAIVAHELSQKYAERALWLAENADDLF